METPLWHTLSPAHVLSQVDGQEKGLSNQEVLLRQKQFGLNQLPKKHADGWVKVLIQQFTSPMIVILLVAAVISLALNELVDAGVIGAAVFVNTIIGFAQEFKANKALEHLRALVQPHATVLRENRQMEILAGDLVPGDILLLNTGDRVTADARLIEGIDLLVNESALTGESMPVQKVLEALNTDTPLAERKNMVYAGTSVFGGRGQAVVVATGLRTQLGTIAKLVEDTEDSQTPLQEQLTRLARWLAAVVVGLVLMIFVVGVIIGQGVFEMFETSVALAVAAIPEGLIVSVTIILAIGMQRILKRKSLVRRLIGAETLGSVSVICSDKTGTITEGEMRVTHLVTPMQAWVYPLADSRHETITKMFEVMAQCNDAVVIDDQGTMRGSPTERALLSAALHEGLDPKTLQRIRPRVDEIPFDSTYKYRATAHQVDGVREVFLTGAPSIVLEKCSKIREYTDDVKVTPQRRQAITQQMEDMASEGIRLIAVAVKITTSTKKLCHEDLQGFTYVGMIGLRDPLRKEARSQIHAARTAGIRTVIITGDHPQTARAIAIEAGILVGPEAVVVGSELDQWSDEELRRRVGRLAVYARVEPRHKIRIVRAWQERGEVVAMTGDGVNDAPALKAADVGVALGSGTEVAKQASDLVLLDNNLGTITSAIEEGRVIFDNIRKTTVYLLSGSFTELTLITLALIAGLPLPITAAQILWINLVTDSFPGIGLALEPGESDVMQLPPRQRSEPVLNYDMRRLVVVIAFILNVGLFGLFLWLMNTTSTLHQVQSMMFVAVSIDSLVFIYAIRSFRRGFFSFNPFSNNALNTGVLIGVGLLLIATLVPFFQDIFQIVPLDLYDWGLLLMIGMVKLVAIEITKEVFLIRDKRIIHS